MSRLDEAAPVRTIGTSRRCLTGRVSLATGGGADFESSLERDWLLVLDFDPSVRLVREQPFSIEYFLGKQKRRYTPDVLVEYERRDSRQTIVYEVKPRSELKANWDLYKARFKAATRCCRVEGWRFKIVTEQEIRTPMLHNARFLRRYRNMATEQTLCDQLLFSLRALGETTPQALLAGAYWHSEARMTALPMLWKLVADRKILTLLDKPLTMSSPIWMAE